MKMCFLRTVGHTTQGCLNDVIVLLQVSSCNIRPYDTENPLTNNKYIIFVVKK